MKNIKILSIVMIIFVAFFISACSSDNGDVEGYNKITAEEAKGIIDTEDNIIILDVRTQEEFDEGHIENAVLLPNTEIAERIEEIIPDKETKILVYCRSGNRSKSASMEMIEMGYMNVYDFGGIIDWDYDIVK